VVLGLSVTGRPCGRATSLPKIALMRSTCRPRSCRRSPVESGRARAGLAVGGVRLRVTSARSAHRASGSCPRLDARPRPWPRRSPRARYAAHVTRHGDTLSPSRAVRSHGTDDEDAQPPTTRAGARVRVAPFDRSLHGHRRSLRRVRRATGHTTESERFGCLRLRGPAARHCPAVARGRRRAVVAPDHGATGRIRGPAVHRGRPADHRPVHVSQHDALAYCAWRPALPTEPSGSTPRARARPGALPSGYELNPAESTAPTSGRGVSRHNTLEDGYLGTRGRRVRAQRLRAAQHVGNVGERCAERSRDAGAFVMRGGSVPLPQLLLQRYRVAPHGGHARQLVGQRRLRCAADVTCRALSAGRRRTLDPLLRTPATGARGGSGSSIVSRRARRDSASARPRVGSSARLAARRLSSSARRRRRTACSTSSCSSGGHEGSIAARWKPWARRRRRARVTQCLRLVAVHSETAC